jgi:hypothetical protein
MMVWADLEVFSFRAISAVVLAVGWFGFFVAAVSRGCGSVAPEEFCGFGRLLPEIH